MLTIEVLSYEGPSIMFHSEYEIVWQENRKMKVFCQIVRSEEWNMIEIVTLGNRIGQIIGYERT